MIGHVATSLLGWIGSINPQVQGATVSAIATIVSVAGTATVAVLGFKHARRLADKAAAGQRQQSIDERRFAVYEDIVRYLRDLAAARPENYDFWPEMDPNSTTDPEIQFEKQHEIEARLVTWASDEILKLWESMKLADQEVDTRRHFLSILRGQGPLVPAVPISAEKIAQHESDLNLSTHKAGRARTAIIDAVRAELVRSVSAI